MGASERTELKSYKENPKIFFQTLTIIYISTKKILTNKNINKSQSLYSYHAKKKRGVKKK